MTQEEILEKLINQIEEKSKEIKEIENVNWKTTCSFVPISGGAAVNLHVESDIDKLALLAGQLLVAQQSFEEGRKALGLDKVSFKWNGFPVESWLNDIKIRVGRLTIKEKKLQLSKMKERLEKILTPDLVRKFEIQKIMDELEKL